MPSVKSLISHNIGYWKSHSALNSLSINLNGIRTILEKIRRIVESSSPYLTEASMSSTFIERDAVRILFILYYCGKERSQLSLFDDNEYTHSIDSESKLQKIDFWLRYPDHFAAALLYGCETGDLTKDAGEIKQIIRVMFHTREPAVLATFSLLKEAILLSECYKNVVRQLGTRNDAN